LEGEIGDDSAQMTKVPNPDLLQQLEAGALPLVLQEGEEQGFALKFAEQAMQAARRFSNQCVKLKPRLLAGPRGRLYQAEEANNEPLPLAAHDLLKPRNYGRKATFICSGSIFEKHFKLRVQEPS